MRMGCIKPAVDYRRQLYNFLARSSPIVECEKTEARTLRGKFLAAAGRALPAERCGFVSRPVSRSHFPACEPDSGRVGAASSSQGLRCRACAAVGSE